MGEDTPKLRRRPRKRQQPQHWWHDQVYPWFRMEVAVAATAATMLTAVVLVRRWVFTLLDGGLLNREVFATATDSNGRAAINQVIDVALQRVTGVTPPNDRPASS